MKSRRTIAMIATMTLVLMVIAGCDREEYEPEATSPEASTTSASDRSHQYTMRVDGEEVSVGEEANVSIHFRPGPDLKINLEYPWDIEFDDIAGLEFESSRLRITDMELTEEQATIPVQLTAHEAGSYRVMANADFSVCNDERCDILRDEPVEFVVIAE